MCCVASTLYPLLDATQTLADVEIQDLGTRTHEQTNTFHINRNGRNKTFCRSSEKL
jgi:hypothetical protein